MCVCVPGNAYVKSFGGTRFIYANKSNTPQEKAASGTAKIPYFQEYKIELYQIPVQHLKRQNLVQGSESSCAAG